MRKNDTWQQDYNQKIHNQKIKNAKSALSKDCRYTSGKDGSKAGSQRDDNTDRKSVYSSGSNISSYTHDEKSDLTKIPLYIQLKTKGLQQYAKELISRGYGYYVDGLTLLSKEELDILLERELNVMPGHKQKF